MGPKIKKNSLSPELIGEIKQALHDLNGWGSVEIFVQDNKIVQINHRSIKKINHSLK